MCKCFCQTKQKCSERKDSGSQFFFLLVRICWSPVTCKAYAWYSSFALKEAHKVHKRKWTFEVKAERQKWKLFWLPSKPIKIFHCIILCIRVILVISEGYIFHQPRHLWPVSGSARPPFIHCRFFCHNGTIHSMLLILCARVCGNYSVWSEVVVYITS